MSSFKVEMIGNDTISMEKIMRGLTLVIVWGLSFMLFNSCMPIDLLESPYENENYAPKIVSANPDPFIGISELTAEAPSLTIAVKITDRNESDFVTVGWYIKDASNGRSVEPIDGSVVLKRATKNENDDSAIFTLDLEFTTKADDFIVCGLNRLILLVSDRGINEDINLGESTYPYPGLEETIKDPEDAEKVKTDSMQWIIRKVCP